MTLSPTINNTGIISKSKAEVSLPFLFWFNKLFSLFWGFWKYCVPWLKYRYKTIKWLLFDDSFMNDRFLRFKRKGISNIPYPHPNKVFRVFPFLTSTFTSYLHVFSSLFEGFLVGGGGGGLYNCLHTHKYDKLVKLVHNTHYN